MSKKKNKESKKKYLPLVFGGLICGGGIASGAALIILNLGNDPAPTNVVTITFNGNSGTIDGRNTINADINARFGDVIKPQASKPGKIFNGWYEDVSCKTRVYDNTLIKNVPKTLYAGYAADTSILVKFDKGKTGCEFEGNVEVVVDAEHTTFNSINKPNAILKDKILDHWSKDPETNIPMEGDDEIPVDGITLYPVFKNVPTDYVTLTFDANGGNALQGTPEFNIPTTTQFSTMSKPIATKNGKDFAFWSLESDPSKATPIAPTQTFNSATRIYAIYDDVDFQTKIYYTEGEGQAAKDYWLTNPTSTTGKLIFQDTDGNQVEEDRGTFNKTITIGTKVETIGINFLYGCTVFNNGYINGVSTNEIPLVIPASVTSIGDSFLHLCASFNQPVSMEACSNLTSIGSSFMQFCTTFNNDLIWPSSENLDNELTIGAFFLQSCSEFNQYMDLPENITTIPSSFMASCEKFNNGQPYSEAQGTKPFIIPANVTKIESYFLSSCFAGVIDEVPTGFNQPITLSNTIESIGEDFLYGNGAFNSPVKMLCPITEIPDAFMTGCTRFTGNYDATDRLVIPNTVTKIGDFFLYTCQSFNQTITIPASVKTLGSSFMSRCTSFNQNITIPENITHVGINFMYYCHSMVSTVTINCDPSTAFTQSDNYTLSSGSPTSPCVLQGITIASSHGYKSAFLTKFGNMDPSKGVTNPPYRVLK